MTARRASALSPAAERSGGAAGEGRRCDRNRSKRCERPCATKLSSVPPQDTRAGSVHVPLSAEITAVNRPCVAVGSRSVFSEAYYPVPRTSGWRCSMCRRRRIVRQGSLRREAHRACSVSARSLIEGAQEEPPRLSSRAYEKRDDVCASRLNLAPRDPRILTDSNRARVPSRGLTPQRPTGPGPRPSPRRGRMR